MSIKWSPVTPWGTSHQAELQGVFYTIDLLLPTEADISNAIVDTLGAVFMAAIKRHAALPTVDQQSVDSIMMG